MGENFRMAHNYEYLCPYASAIKSHLLVQQLVAMLTAFLPFRVRNSRKKREREREKCAEQLLNVVTKVQIGLC